MMDSCAAAPGNPGFVSSASAFIDCHADLLGWGAYQSLAAPGSTLSIVLSGLLTIFVALIGYSLLLGEGPTLRSGTLAMAKIGLIFTLATSWPAYRTLVYDLVTEGPIEIVGNIGKPIGLSSDRGKLVERLDLADAQLVQLSILGPGDPLWAAQSARVAAPPFAGFSAFALGTSRVVFLLAAIAGQGIVRATIGLLLALGPFFVALLMFEGTSGFFVGWVRVLSGAAIGSIGVSITLGLELEMMEPWLSSLLSRRLAGEALPSMPTELAVITIMFAILVFVVIGAAARTAASFRLPVPASFGLLRNASASISGQEVSRVSSQRFVQREERSRAVEIADTMARTGQRERVASVTERPRPIFVAEGGSRSAARSADMPHSLAGSRRSSFRRSMPRVSATARKRDNHK